MDMFTVAEEGSGRLRRPKELNFEGRLISKVVKAILGAFSQIYVVLC